MGFLKVFRWILFGFGMMYAFAAGFFALYYIVPDGMIKQIIEEYVTISGLSVPFIIMICGFLAGICIVLFIIFHIICIAHKRRQERVYSTPTSTSSSSSISSASSFLSSSHSSKTDDNEGIKTDLLDNDDSDLYSNKK